MFDSFYHLHIPKTGGRYLRYNVINILLPYIEERGIKVIDKGIPITDPKYHGCWSTEITDNTYIVSSLRDPITQLISLFFHIVAKDKEPQVYPNPTKYDEGLMTKEILFESLKELPYFFTSFQSKNLLYEAPYYNGAHDASIKSTTHVKLLLERVKRINLLIRMEDMRTLTPEDIAQKLIDDLGLNLTINEFMSIYKEKEEELRITNTIIKTDIVQEFSDSLSTSDKRKLYPYISEDSLLYTGNRSLFYNFNKEAL